MSPKDDPQTAIADMQMYIDRKTIGFPSRDTVIRWYTSLTASLASLEAQLAECYRWSGADPDGNEDWRLATRAVAEVKRLREESDAENTRLESQVASLEADLATNARLLARQCDLARDAETTLASLEAEKATAIESSGNLVQQLLDACATERREDRGNACLYCSAADVILWQRQQLTALTEAHAHHFCIKCHRRWEGDLRAEYCGDCHRSVEAHARQRRQDFEAGWNLCQGYTPEFIPRRGNSLALRRKQFAAYLASETTNG